MQINKTKWERHAYFWMNECEDYIRTWKDFSDFSLSMFKLDWSARRRSSRGGLYGSIPGINIAMSIACKEYSEVNRVYEYKSFDSDSEIGGFYYKDANLKLGMHICHEMAHAVQYYSSFTLGKNNFDKPHGVSFKRPYRALRNRILNPHLECQSVLKQEYEKPIKMRY